MNKQIILAMLCGVALLIGTGYASAEDSSATVDTTKVSGQTPPEGGFEWEKELKDEPTAKGILDEETRGTYGPSQGVTPLK